MAPIPNQYGSITPDEAKDSTLELLPSSNSVQYSRLNSDGTQEEGTTWTNRHRLVSYLLTAGVCFIAARYWHDRAAAPTPGSHHDVVVNNNAGRVPMPPALSTLDPRELKFRSVKREGLASPSQAWGDYLTGDGDKESKFVPLPTNQWYLVRHYIFMHSQCYVCGYIQHLLCNDIEPPLPQSSH